MNEIWKDIEEYEGLYQVSNLGQVRSLNYLGNTGQTKILKPVNNGFGYLRVALYKEHEKKRFLVHRLVAEAFIPNPLNLPQINHLDEDKSNNRVDNLEFCTAKYNTNFGTCIERRAAKQSKQVLQFDKDGNLIRTWPSTQEIKRQLGFNQGHISDCCNGKLKSAHGYIWRYV